MASSESPLIPRFVLREAVVNAVMHRDYRDASAVKIIRYSDRIEIRNPGCSLKPMDQLGQVGSKLRNPDIARILYQLQLAEAMGSGLSRIKAALAERDLPEPSFESSRTADEFVTVFMLGGSGTSDGSGFGSGSGDGSGYGDGLPHGDFDKSRKPDDKSRKPDVKSRKPGDKPRNAELPDEIRQKVDLLGGKAEPTAVRELIVEICSIRDFSANELASLLGRSRDHLVREHLKPLVENGELEQTHPENPRHPKQAYRTTGSGRVLDE